MMLLTRTGCLLSRFMPSSSHFVKYSARRRMATTNNNNNHDEAKTENALDKVLAKRFLGSEKNIWSEEMMNEMKT